MLSGCSNHKFALRDDTGNPISLIAATRI